MNVAVVIPLDPATSRGEGVRGRAYNFVLAHLASLDAHVVPGICHGEWCKADAVADGLQHVNGADIVIVHDADVVAGQRSLERALECVDAGATSWAMPHTEVHRLDEQATERTLEGGVLPDLGRQGLVRWPYVGVMGGGVVVLRRDVYDDCPLDRRFKGWGNEDISWGFALECLYGPVWRDLAPLRHLWHPHAAPGAQRSPLVESERLRRAYRAYRRRPDQMRALIDSVTIAT